MGSKRRVMSDQGPLCFTCGQATGSPARLNRLEDGSVCPGCRERLEADLPPLLPGFGQGVPTEYGAPEEAHEPILAPLRRERGADEGEPDEGPLGA